MTLEKNYERVEGAAVFLLATFLYFYLGYKILWFVVLLLSIDIFMLGYFANNKIGAYIYNLGHTYLLPCALCVIALATHNNLALAFSLIWFAHIGMDRAVGYGLKLETGFKHTTLGKLGK